MNKHFGSYTAAIISCIAAETFVYQTFTLASVFERNCDSCTHLATQALNYVRKTACRNVDWFTELVDGL